MFRPITVAPTFDCISSTTGVLALTSPPSSPCCRCQASRSKSHSCRRMPPTPSGFSSLWSGPATYPSTEMATWNLSLVIEPHRLIEAPRRENPRADDPRTAERTASRSARSPSGVSLRAGLTIPNRFDSPECLQSLLNGQQDRSLELRQRPSAADGDRYGCHRHVVRSLPQGVPVVVPERVPETMKLAPNGLNVGSRGVASILGVLGQPRPRLGGVAEAGEVQGHGSTPPFGQGLRVGMIRRSGNRDLPSLGASSAARRRR